MSIARSKACWPPMPSPERGPALAAAGFRDTYVADLDAIEQRGPKRGRNLLSPEKDSRPLFRWAIYEELFEAGLEPWIDAGVSNVEQAGEMARFEIAAGAARGSWPGSNRCDPAALGRTVRARRTRAADLQPRSETRRAADRLAGLARLDAEQIAASPFASGVRRMIVLDLARSAWARASEPSRCAAICDASSELANHRRRRRARIGRSRLARPGRLRCGASGLGLARRPARPARVCTGWVR